MQLDNRVTPDRDHFVERRQSHEYPVASSISANCGGDLRGYQQYHNYLSNHGLPTTSPLVKLATVNGTSKLGKRRADDSNLNDDDRFAKRLNRLSLDLTDDSSISQSNLSSNGNGNFYIGLPPSNSPDTRSVERQHYAPGLVNREEDGMTIDETPHRVYISSLEDELAEIEAFESRQPDENRLIFLPDIEQYFSKIPAQALKLPSSTSNTSTSGNTLGGGRNTEEEGVHQELVLYSNSAPWLGTQVSKKERSVGDREEPQNTRKAILEARHKAKALEAARDADMSLRYSQHPGLDFAAETAHGYTGGYGEEMPEDADAMDMD